MENQQLELLQKKIELLEKRIAILERNELEANMIEIHNQQQNTNSTKPSANNNFAQLGEQMNSLEKCIDVLKKDQQERDNKLTELCQLIGALEKKYTSMSNEYMQMQSGETYLHDYMMDNVNTPGDTTGLTKESAMNNLKDYLNRKSQYRPMPKEETDSELAKFENTLSVELIDTSDED